MFKKFIKKDKVRIVLSRFFDWVVAGIVATLITILIGSPTVKSIVFAVVVAVLVIIVLAIISYLKDDSGNILKIMKKEMEAGNYPIVIRIGYTLSRPLHLSGRYSMRKLVGEQTLEACQRMEPTRTVRINGEKMSVKYIEAFTHLDDLGWNLNMLGDVDSAIEHIEKGIEIASTIPDYKLMVKGYRHLLGISNKRNEDEKAKHAETEARKILNSGEYKSLFSEDEKAYEHAVAEFDYAYAKTLLDENRNEALKIAERVKEIFSSEKTDDMDRYVKTFDLIGDIYARSEKPEKLKKAKQVYLDGIRECKKHGRTERLIRISIDYINLMTKIMRTEPGMYTVADWKGSIEEEEKKIYDQAADWAKRVENKKCQRELQVQHKEFLREKKRLRVERY